MFAIKRVVVQLVSVAILSLGFAQFSVAGLVSTSDVISSESRGERISKIEALIVRDDVADQLQRFGVSKDFAIERVRNMSDAELLELESGIEEQVAGGDLVGVIGVVFVVLLILELVGVTDIFKAF